MSIIIYTTFSNKKLAIDVAQKLVKKHLATCVQISKIKSLYTWKRNIHESKEFRLCIKTKASLYKKVSVFLKKHHEYQTPQIVAIKINHIDSAYKKWLYDSTL